MTRHMDAPMDANVNFMVLCFMYANVDAMQSFCFLYMWMICYGVMMHDGGVT